MYTVETEEVPNKKGCWSSTLVKIFQDGKEIGNYLRNYSSYGKTTFCPFTKDGKDYALYSKHYTATRIMSLPDCKDLGGEEPDDHGFCPVEFYVPEETKGKFGFVCGCVWGDDNGAWKLKVIDLEKVEEGILKIEDKFGYFEINTPLKDNINMWSFDEDCKYFSLNRVINVSLDTKISDIIIGQMECGQTTVEVMKYLKNFCETCGYYKEKQYNELRNKDGTVEKKEHQGLSCKCVKEVIPE